MKLSEQSWDAQRMLQEYGLELQAWQLDILRNWKEGILLVKAARRTGKDTLCARLATELVRAGYDVVIAYCSQSGVEAMREAFDRIRGDLSPLHRPASFSAFEVTHHEEGRVSKIMVRSRMQRGCAYQAEVGIVNEAGCVGKDEITALFPCCKRMPLNSSWPPEPDRTSFGWQWRYGDLAWRRLEIPAELEHCKEHADHFSDHSVYNDLLRSPEELGRKTRC